MTKRAAVGPKNRSGYKIRIDGKMKVFLAGELLPEGTVVPNRFFRDKRTVWVEDEPVKKARPKPTPKTEAKAETIGTPSPSSEGAGASAPAPLEVTATENKSTDKKTKRKRKKLFGSG